MEYQQGESSHVLGGLLVEESKPSKAFYSLLDEGMQLMLHDMVNDASWKKEELEEKLLQDIFLRLFACIPPSIVAIEDVLMWNSLQDDNMSVINLVDIF